MPLYVDQQITRTVCELDISNAVFTHGQLYVAVSWVTSVYNIKAIWDSKIERSVTKNIVYPEVIID